MPHNDMDGIMFGHQRDTGYCINEKKGEDK